MEDEPLRELAGDIKANGQTHLITLHEGKILDGRNRYRACRLAGVKQIKKQEEAATLKDEIGRVVPSEVVDDWQRAAAFAPMLRKISDVKCAVDDGLQQEDVIMREIHNTTVSRLIDCYHDLQRIIPH